MKIEIWCLKVATEVEVEVCILEMKLEIFMWHMLEVINRIELAGGYGGGGYGGDRGGGYGGDRGGGGGGYGGR